MSVKEDFEENGFIVARGLLTSDECAAFKRETQRLVEKHGDHAGVFVGLAANSPLFAAARSHPALLNALEAIIGSDIEFLSDKVVFKSRTTDFGSPWHQDWLYWRGLNKVSAWIALDPATIETGCLKVLPGSHKNVVVHDGVAPPGEGFGHRLREGVVKEDKALSIPCEVGDAIFFHDLLLHASHPNLAGTDRYSFITTYRSCAEPDLAYSWAVAAKVVRGTATGEASDVG